MKWRIKKFYLFGLEVYRFLDDYTYITKQIYNNFKILLRIDQFHSIKLSLRGLHNLRPIYLPLSLTFHLVALLIIIFMALKTPTFGNNATLKEDNLIKVFDALEEF